jgi:hypothetical protein
MQTLIVAALASGVAAIVVSHLWDKGTIVASAMTPVIVAIVSEMLHRPIQSEVVRRPVRAVGSVTAPRRVWRRGEARPPSGRTPSVMAPPPAGIDDGLRHREEGLEPGPVRVYSSGSNRRPLQPGSRGRLHLKVAIVTGLVGFLIAAAALTLPELIFGGSVTGHRSTTYFGGGSQTQTKKARKQDNSTGGKANSPSKPNQPSTGTTTTPPPTATGGTTTTPPPTGSTAPSQPPPTAPAPTTPAPQAPAPTP